MARSEFNLGNKPEIGSPEWFSKVFDVWSESRGVERVRQRLAVEGREGDFREVVDKWVSTQVFFFLTEFGAGKTLALQPPYEAEIYQEEDGVRVFAFNLKEYGDQKKSYVDFDGIDESVREGLAVVYGELAEMEPGQGLVRLSPSEFYKDFGSSYDVIELYRVLGVNEDGSKKMEGRYVVLDRVLRPEERMFVQSMFAMERAEDYVMGSNGDVLAYDPENFVMNPMRVDIGVDSEATTRLAELINSEFEDRFGEQMISETDFAMYELIQNRVDKNVSNLVDLLLAGEKEVFVSRLSGLMEGSQREWAVRQGLDADEHMWKIRTGQIPVGFEVGFGGDLWSRDPVSGQWISNGLETKRYCEIHDETYTEVSCPKCNRKELHDISHLSMAA